MDDTTTIIIGILTIVILATMFAILGGGILMNYMKNKHEDEEKLSISERKRRERNRKI